MIQIYSKNSSLNLNEDYDLALYDFISSEFKNSKIKYFYVKNLKGNNRSNREILVPFMKEARMIKLE